MTRRWPAGARCVALVWSRRGGSATSTHHKFVALDGLRGVAAIVVVTGHAIDPQVLRVLPGSYFTVDMFFVLSGFVVAHAYQARLDAGLGWGEFMLARLIRLYPLYLLGTVIAVALVVAHHWIHTRVDPIGWRTVVAGLLFLPTPERVPTGFLLYPLNATAWSLLFELIVNAGFAGVARHLTDRRLGGLLAVGALALVATALTYGSVAAGFSWPTAAAGFGRVGYAFFAGVAADRLWRRGVWPALALPPAAVVALFIALLAIPLGPWRAAVDIGVVLVALPLLILAAARGRPVGLTADLCAAAGGIAYSMSVLHLPVRNWLLSAGPHLTGREFKDYGVAGTFALVVMMVPVALAVDRVYDTPLRRWLTRRLRRPAAPPPLLVPPAAAR